MKSTIDSVSDCDLLVQSVIYHDLNVVHLFVDKKQIVYQKFTKIQSSSRWLKSTVHTHVFQKNQRKSKRIGCLLLFMAPLPFAPPCLSVETPWLTAGPTKATGKNDRHPMDVWKLMARLVRWQQKSLPTKYLPNFISKGFGFLLPTGKGEGDESSKPGLTLVGHAHPGFPHSSLVNPNQRLRPPEILRKYVGNHWVLARLCDEPFPLQSNITKTKNQWWVQSFGKPFSDDTEQEKNQQKKDVHNYI